MPMNGDPSGCCWYCITPDTLITLSDGTTKRVDELNETDKILVYDFDSGEMTEAPITFLHRVNEEAMVLRVSFSDGTEIGVVGEHCFFDMTDRRFIAVNNEEQAKELIGHRFTKLEDGELVEVTLTGIRKDGITDSYYSPVSEAYFNCFANGLLSMSGFMKGLYNVFELEETALKYDAGKKAAEIKAAGELQAEDLAGIVSREFFEKNRGGWISVSIAKGLTTIEDLIRLFSFCRPFFVGE